MNPLSKKITSVSQQIGSAKLLVVTKNRSAEEIQEVILTGARYIGENKIQEILGKYNQSLFDELKKYEVELHFIGHLQSNKVNQAVRLCDAIQSVDSMELAEKINDAAKKENKIIKIFLQMNLTGEQQKFGIKEEQMPEIIEGINQLENIKLTGLMCMGKFGDEKITREAFRKCKNLAEKFHLPEVSMGMSDDYQIALEEGSTMVRLGSIIFE